MSNRLSHGHERKGQRSSLYSRWCAMKTRCGNPNAQHFAYYGGRGIQVCQEWLECFEAFAAWARRVGYRDGLLLDRNNNQLGYDPNNCRWVTDTESSRNRRNVIHVEAFGEIKVMKAWAADPRCAVPWGTLRGRLESGYWSAEEAIATPSQGRPRHRKPRPP